MKNLVTPAWLASHLGAAGLVIFDATKYLPTEPYDGLTKFREAHIAGARFFDLDLYADQDTDLPHMVPTPGRFAKLIGAEGVENTTRVVFYDQKGIHSAPRGWWLMRLMGHEKVAVLDGGLPAWLKAELPIAIGDPRAVAPTTFTPDFRAERLKGIGDIKRIIEEKDALIIDSDGTLKPRDALRARFAEAGVDGTRPVVTSCGTGVTACVLALGMAQAGLPEPAIYDGSWTEWALRPETAKAIS
jgi:thiosulfate/3-mercaptopyruvate sulfurtransferase